MEHGHISEPKGNFLCPVPTHIVPKGTGLSNRTSRQVGHQGCDLAPSEAEGRMPSNFDGCRMTCS